MGYAQFSGKELPRRSPRQEESRLQQACVRLFALRWPRLEGLLLAVPNGGRRDATTGARLKKEGVVAGVSDLLLLAPSPAGAHGLCIEMKTPSGRQSPAQRAWQQKVEARGYRYALCRSLEEFASTVEAYLQGAGG